MLTWLASSRAHVLTCLTCSHSHVSTCLACLGAHVTTCLAWLRAHVLTFLRAHVLRLRINVSCVLTCSSANVPWVLTRSWVLMCLSCQHALRAYVCMCQSALWAHVLTFKYELSSLPHVVCVTTWSPTSMHYLLRK